MGLEKHLHLAAQDASGDREAVAEADEEVLSAAAAKARRPERTKRLNFIVTVSRSSKQNWVLLCSYLKILNDCLKTNDCMSRPNEREQARAEQLSKDSDREAETTPGGR